MSDATKTESLLSETVLSRRSFVKMSAAVGGTAALAGGGVKYGLEWANRPAAAQGETTVVPTGCAHNCGGRCAIRAWVEDGRVTRIETDQRPDSFEDPQLRACMRGRSNRKRLYHPDRLKYPMKRVGERGSGEFERISWDEALDTVAEEMTRIKEEYGPESMYRNYATGGGSTMRGSINATRLMNLFGGQLNSYNNYSWAAAQWATPYSLGTQLSGSSRDDWVNSKLILAWGFNPAEMIFGTNTQYYLKEAQRAGAKVIVIDPRMTMTASAIADEWVPIRPGTDNALMDAMAYVMISEDLHDQDFLDTYTVGFDEDHMPDDIPPGNSYRSYVMGEGEDGTAKTPEWAESITLIPRDRIVRLAREFATTKPAALIQGTGMNRRAYGEQPVRGGINLAAMTGNVGINGGWASGIALCERGMSVGGFPGGENPVEAAIPVYRWTDAVVRGTEMGPEDGVVGVDRLPSNIKFIYNCGGNCLVNQHGDINQTVEILKDTSLVEFIVVHEHFMNASAKFADILLPAAMDLEQDDLSTTWAWGESLIAFNKAVDPLYEARTDYDICADIAERLGIGEEFTEGKTQEEWLREAVEVTEETYDDFPGYEAWREEGIYVAKFDEPFVAFKDFRDDPEGNPLETPSGKIEIFSKAIWDLDREGLPAVAQYVPEWEGGPWDPLYEKYPLSCMGTHYQRRSHSTYDESPWLDEAMPQRLYMNPVDAEPRGIEDGDLVRIFNDRGEVRIEVRVTPRLVPGLVNLPQGGWWQPDENGVDTGGAVNTLTSMKVTPGAFGNAQHTMLVEVEKA
ncbi:MAG: DMSO/selenate family reductase complex A subunit [Egibacteraceae bacterium]